MTSSANLSVQNLIDGEFRAPSSGLFFAHESPSLNTDVVQVPQSDVMDVVQLIQAMNRANTAWIKATREERDLAIRKTLVGFASKLEASHSELAETLSSDIGMPVTLGLSRSVPAAIAIVHETLKQFEKSRANDARFPSTGNAAVFLGWTDPLLSFCRRVPVILAAGNAVAVKPSSRAPRTVVKVAKFLSEAMIEAALPVGLFGVLNGFGAGEDHVGEALLRHPGFKTIYWIGRSDAAVVARDIALAHDKRFFFTGSGRNPAILFQGFSDEVHDQLLDGIAGAIVDPHGFGPYRPSRLFVQDAIYKSTLETLAQKLSKLTVGPLPRREAERFDTQVQLALSETGHLVQGGKRDGLFAQPTLIRDLTNCSTLQSEELAGPWATIASFKYPHEALKYANTSPLGLAGFVMHPVREKAEGVAQKLEASRVFFSSQPSWPQALTTAASSTKQSGNMNDGIESLLFQNQWRSTWFA